MNRKVLHLITGLDIGGAEEMILKVVPELNERGLKNRVMCIKGRGPIGQELETKGVVVDYLDFNSLWDAPQSFLKFLSSLKKWRPDVLVTHLVHADILGRMGGSFILGIAKSIVYRHGPYLNWEWWSRVDRWTQTRVARYCVVSRWLEKELLRKGFDRGKVKFLPNAVAMAPFEHVPAETAKKYRKELNLSESTLVLGAMSTLKPGKGYDELIEAVSRLKKRDPLKLLILGEGPERTALEEKVKNRGLGDTIRFLGFRRDVAGWLSTMDLFVLPTHFEGMSVALLQAMAAGKCIITTDIEANRDLVTHGESAVLVSVQNPKALACAIEFLLNDPRERQRLGENARKRCRESFSLEAHVKEFAAILKNV